MRDDLIMCTDELNDLRIQYSHIRSQLGKPGDYIELEVRGRRVKRSDAMKHMEVLKADIRELERRLEASRGPTRNKARLGRA